MPELDLVSVDQAELGSDALAVDPRPVSRSEIADLQLTTVELDPGVLPGNLVVIERDLARGGAPDGQRVRDLASKTERWTGDEDQSSHGRAPV